MEKISNSNQKVTLKMGGSDSKEEKTVDSTGVVNNNLVIEDTLNVKSDSIFIVLVSLLIIRIVEVLYFSVQTYRRNIKKKVLEKRLQPTA